MELAGVSQTVLLTGGTGFFGKALLRRWLEHEAGGTAPPRVVLLSRDPHSFKNTNPQLCAGHWLSLIQGDILDPSSLASIAGVTHVLHAAADSTNGNMLTPLQRFDQILTGTRNVLDWAVRLGARRFLLCSSGGVYGRPPPGAIHIEETWLGIPDPLNPGNAYSIAKRAAEHLGCLYKAAYGLEVVAARCFAFVGQDLPRGVHFAIGNFIRDAIEQPKLTVTGDGSPLRSYLDQRDLADWLCVMLQSGAAGKAYNVGSEEAISIADLAQLVRDELAPHKPVEILGKLGQLSDRSTYVPSTKLAQQELGLIRRFDLRQAVRDAALLC